MLHIAGRSIERHVVGPVLYSLSLSMIVLFLTLLLSGTSSSESESESDRAVAGKVAERQETNH